MFRMVPDIELLDKMLASQTTDAIVITFRGIGECRMFRGDHRNAYNDDPERQCHEPNYSLPVHVRLLYVN